MLAELFRRFASQTRTRILLADVNWQALEHVLVEQQVELARELEPEILKVAKDQNGNHVVQKVIELVPRQQVGFIMDAFRGHASSLAAHNYACRVIQRLLEYGSDRDKADLLAELHKSAHQLFSDQYGNYVVQHIIENSSVEDRAKIIRLVSADFVSLSTHKYASNVVEKCIERGSRDDRNELARQLMAPADANGNNAMISLMKDQYGNYVIRGFAPVGQAMWLGLTCARRENAHPSRGGRSRDAGRGNESAIR